METSATETSPEKYIFVCFLVETGSTKPLDFRAKTIEQAVDLLKAAVLGLYYRRFEPECGGGTTACTYEASIQCGALIWYNEDPGGRRVDDLDAAYDLRTWRTS